MLSKLSIRVYGMRVAEPHHDGTPHWHALLFAAPRSVAQVLRLVNAEWLSESPDEPGARQHRVRVVRINPVKGSAVGYVAKYLAKNVDGHQLEFTQSRDADGEVQLTGDAPKTAAERIRAWASAWGVRQFQFFGAPPVLWWRELRRLRDETSEVPAIESARAPADAGDYAGHVEAAGGVCVARAQRPLFTWREDRDGENRYGEPLAQQLRGVAAFRTIETICCEMRDELNPPWLGGVRSYPVADSGVDRVCTRKHDWSVGLKALSLASAPWTRVNNCNRPDRQVSGGLDRRTAVLDSCTVEGFLRTSPAHHSRCAA
jgi:hypothetical protein